jgi:hypothetical protein
VSSRYLVRGVNGSRPWLRLAGGILGGCLSATAFAVGSALGLTWSFLGPVDIPTLGLGIGAIVGAASGPAAVEATDPGRFASLVAFKAAVIGVTSVVGAVEIYGRLSGMPGTDGASVIGFALVAVPVGLTIGLFLTVPVAAVSTAALRVGSRSRALLAAIIATALLMGLVIAPKFAARRLVLNGGASLPGSSVRVNWTIENHSPRDLVVGIWSSSADSTRGWTQGVAACFTSIGSTDEPEGWFLSLDRDSEGVDIGVPEPRISARDAPGSVANVWIRVERDGSMSSFANRPQPPEDRLTVDLCSESAT